MNDTVNVNLTTNEAQILIQLIDIAVKSQGLAVAEAGFVLSKKIQEGLKNKPNTNVFTMEQ